MLHKKVSLHRLKTRLRMSWEAEVGRRKLRLVERDGGEISRQLLADDREESHRGRRLHGGTTTKSSADQARPAT